MTTTTENRYYVRYSSSMSAMPAEACMAIADSEAQVRWYFCGYEIVSIIPEPDVPSYMRRGIKYLSTVHCSRALAEGEYVVTRAA